MQYAHEHGTIHRNLKPQVVLLTAEGQPKISSFELARVLGQESAETEEGTLVGTPMYMSPEQLDGVVERIGPATDIYALGVILYHLLAGQLPFGSQPSEPPGGVDILGTSIATAAAALRQQVRSEQAPPLRLSCANAPDLEAICLKCLDKEPAKRYASAGELADDLQRFQRGVPVKARPVGLWERWRRWLRRRWSRPS